MLLKPQKFVLVTHRFFHFSNVVKSCQKNVVKLCRIVPNTGCFFAGCCFSRQSDEESLISKVKENHGRDSINIEANDYVHGSSNLKFDTESENMKRTSDCVISQDLNSHERVDLTQCVSNKRKKIFDEEPNSCDVVIENKEINNEKNFSYPVSESPKHNKKELSEKKDQLTRIRPNYFVAVKISDQEIHENLKNIQNHILEKELNLKKSMTELKTLHITLMVMYIGDAETHARAMQALKSVHQEHDREMSCNPVQLEFKGLGHFQNRVLFAKLCADNSYTRLRNLAASVKDHFAANDIVTTDKRKEFTPHLTVAKIDFKKKQNKFVKKINPELYKDYVDQYFGSQRIESIQLLSMTDPKNDEGYYSGDEIYFSAFDPTNNMNALCDSLEIDKKKKDVKDAINSLMKEKLK